MAKQERGDRGRFAAKSDEPREVRSLRLTHSTWEELGTVADSQRITRSDLIEQLVESGTLENRSATSGITLQQVEEAISQILNDPWVTRSGKDKGSARRALEALRDCLF